ncbi:hypothetical protein M8818_006027 [Zalaria obscura]|uniref:Uncharacterized protein n=1 Tax=Zalaria obscura TaxID=2024903 RepID=A0ACC3SB36_9PEZI
MPAQVTVIYPSASDAKFDMDYYLSSHMPLVQKLWGPAGLKGWKVIKFGDDAPYSVQATLEWDSMEDFQKAAAGEHTKEIMGDVTNFSNQHPHLMPGEVVGSATV